ncbi:hypothetical protein ACFU0X_20560 [Streptomyces cellulosae]|uniref:Uncharacterized protein n=1 Tax=Streptomyces cellulosae TaxID=1968 RepID=A0ABW6JJ44_STRCE
MSEQLAVAGTKVATAAAAEALKMARSAASPYVMVKHGRREDRAAAYDRFVAACAVLFSRTRLDDNATTELVVSYMAIEMRAPTEVRRAAYVMFRRIIGISALIGGTSPSGWWRVPDEGFIEPEDPEAGLLDDEDDQEQSEGADGEAALEEGVSFFDPLDNAAMIKPFGDSDELLRALELFTHIARRDVRARWWHPVVMPWRSSWWPRRKGRGRC